MRKILEGMRAGDLEDLVLPLISIDEYESKIDDSAIVLGFYVNEQGAAEDLNRFIQRSPVELLDTEISPAPDSQGYFMVFVELLGDTRFGENVTNLLEEIASLTNIERWKMKIRGIEHTVPYDEDVLADAISREPDAVREGALQFLTPSDLSDARFEADKLILENAYHRVEFDLIGFGPADEVLKRNGLSGYGQSLTMQDVARSTHFATMLGEGWQAIRLGTYDVFAHAQSDNILLLAP